jgi:hypothetical protein
MTRDANTLPGAAVVVLGMARSGTSAITRLLELLGMELGPAQALLPPAGENSKGFFEHRPIVQINKELLERMGGSWSEPPRFAQGWERDPGLEDLRKRARELLAADFGSAPLWGFKDPRTSLTLPFWDELLGREAGYVICHRRPLDSARSLEQRNGIRLDDGVALWTHYMASALANTAGRRRIVVGYEELLSDRETLVGELADFLGVGERGAVGEPGAVGERGAGSQVRAKVREWIEEDLRHHASTLRELVEHPAVSAEAQALHLLLELAIAERGGEQGAIDEALDGMARTLLRHEAARAALAAKPIVGEDRGSVSAQPARRRAASAAQAADGIEASIVVVVADDPWGAMACLESLGDLERGSPRHEVVLVDNASVGLRSIIAALAGEVRLVQLPERVGVSEALRQGVLAAQAEIVLCLPTPALLAEDALSVLCAALGASEPGASELGACELGACELGASGPAAVASVDPGAGAAQPSASAPHPAAGLALALRRDALPTIDVPDEQTIGALCFELARQGQVIACAEAHVSPPRAPLCRRGPGAEEIEVSVIVPTLDATSAEVRDCLRALQATIRAPHEIVVVDNGAPPQGFTAPVNAALRAARGRYLVVVNDDVRVLDGWWEPLADALEHGAPLVFPLTVQGRMRWEFAAWCFAMRCELLERMAVRPDEFFDPSMVVWCQDADLRKRMAAAGMEPLCVPQSRIRHAGSRTVRVSAPHHALRNWIHAQAGRDTEVFKARYPQETNERERDGLPPGLPLLTAEHIEMVLAQEPIAFQADGPAWRGHTLDWPDGAGHFFLAGDIEVRAGDPVEDILVRAIFRGKEEELFWINLVPGVVGTGRRSFSLPREHARVIPRGADAPPAQWSQVRSVHLCARSRLRGGLQRAPASDGATTATISHLRLLALPA